MTYLELLNRIANNTNTKVIECYGILYTWDGQNYTDLRNINLKQRLNEVDMPKCNCIKSLKYEADTND